MDDMLRQNKAAWSALALSVSAATVSATYPIHYVPCQIITSIWDVLRGVAPIMFGIMFLFGAARYAYSADDPGGRKQGKNIIIHAIIGALILGALTAILAIMAGMPGGFPLC